MSSLKERVKSLQADTTNTDTALTTLEEALAEKVGDQPRFLTHTLCLSPRESRSHSGHETGGEDRGSHFGRREKSRPYC